ncbi:LysR family transcriptional regulator [Pantoea ananatis]|uniref:LysR family transcriptional regulator n=1 Tax=Pantoea ananas TaxID=553 RepID=UPI001F4EF013|nr:LysR family transcriptional regulator [Pantoea ananatis]MCH9271895.1 LysR family transcriptional regulator [Pantoea ananatis]
MKIRDIEYFVALAEQGSFKKAAIHCHTTQPTISNSIMRMERELGISLFKRTTRSVALTHKGFEVLEYSHSILLNVNIIKDISKSVAKSFEIINLGISISLAHYFYDKIYHSFSSANYQHIRVHEIPKENLKSQLNSGAINCMLLSCESELDTYDKILIAEYPFLLGVNLGDEFIGRKNITPFDLKKRRILITQNNKYDTSLNQFILKNELNYNQDLILNSAEVVKMAIKSNQGIGIIPQYASNSNDSIQYLSFLDGSISIKIFMVFRKNDPCIEKYKKISTEIKKSFNG